MILRYLLDTNVLSEPARQRPNRGVMRGLERHEGKVATAAPVWHELVYGCVRLPTSPQRQTLERYLHEVLGSLPVLPYDEHAAEWHGRERARLRAMGRTPTFVDGQIAAVAHVRGLVVVTHNIADYAAFDDLLVEDWMS